MRRTPALLASALLALLALRVPSACAQGAFATPPASNGSVAVTDDAGAWFANPAATGLRRGGEFALSWLDEVQDAPASVRPFAGPVLRGAASFGPLGLTVTAPQHQRPSWSFGVAGGRELRFGAQVIALTSGTWAAGLARDRGGLEAALDRGELVESDRVSDLRIGSLARPAPWISLGAVIDHLAEPRLSGARLDREYTLGLGWRPLAMSRGAAHTLGPRLTLSADVALREDDPVDAARVRIGAGLEIAPGIELRGAAEDHGGVRFGIRLTAPHSELRADAQQREGDADPIPSATLAWFAAEEPTALPQRGRVAVLRAGGTLADDARTSVSVFGIETGRPVEPLRRDLERAQRDPNVRGVLLDVSGVAGMAPIEELRARIAALRRAGKPVVAYIEYGGRRPDLYLASACDRVVTSPESFWGALGLHAERRYYRRALADWGVRIDRTSYGKYKSAYRNFSVDSTSDADREVTEYSLDVSQRLFTTALAADRGLDGPRLQAALDGHAWRAHDLVRLGLVDSVGHREDALRMLGTLAGLGSKPRRKDFRGEPEARRDWNVPRRIAIVYASGAIESGRSGNDLLTGAYMGDITINRQLEAAFKNPAVDAVVLRIDSPGGSSVASELIHHTADRLKRETKKPLIVSMGRYAASGGYHIALAGDRVYADRYTLTGSIGVLLVRYSIERWLREHHIRQDDFERGAYMRYWSTGHDWDARAQAAADSATFREYRDFVALVAERRGLSYEQADAVAQGRVWFGEDALARKLVDEIGGLDAAIAEARRRAKVPAGEHLEPVEYRQAGPGLIGRLLGSWVRERFAESTHLPAPVESRFWMDPDAVPVE